MVILSGENVTPAAEGVMVSGDGTYSERLKTALTDKGEGAVKVADTLPSPE
jgi:hypothetical protein